MLLMLAIMLMIVVMIVTVFVRREMVMMSAARKGRYHSNQPSKHAGLSKW